MRHRKDGVSMVRAIAAIAATAAIFFLYFNQWQPNESAVKTE
jgi:hypothetical protein